MKRFQYWMAPLLFALVVSVPALAQNSLRVVHVFVALADNLNQGIVPVPSRLGNGEDAEGNLYWGAAYGIKTFFFRSADWKPLSSGGKPTYEVLERCVFKHRTADVYLVADAYRGRELHMRSWTFWTLRPAAAPSRSPLKMAPKG
jgi:hypothetical protein